MSLLDDWIAQAKERRASDVHIVANLPVRCRVDGQLENLTAYPLSLRIVKTWAGSWRGSATPKWKT